MHNESCSIAPGTFHAGVIITSANRKDGCPYGGPSMVATWQTSIFLIEQTVIWRWFMSTTCILSQPNANTEQHVIYPGLVFSWA